MLYWVAAGYGRNIHFTASPDTIVEIALLLTEDHAEMLQIKPEKYEVLSVLPQEEMAAFLGDFQNVPCYLHGPPPNAYSSGCVVRFTYADGRFDLVDRSGRCPYTKDGTVIPGRAVKDAFYFCEEFDSLCSKYFGTLYDPIGSLPAKKDR